MRFRTKLIITSVVIVIFPLFLVFGLFLVGGRYIAQKQISQERSGSVDYNMVSNPIEAFARGTDELIKGIEAERLIHPFILENPDVLRSIDEEVASLYSYIIVKRGDVSFYVAAENAENAESIISELNYEGGGNSIFVLPESRLFVRQYNFIFSTGEPGSLYIISGIKAEFPKSLIIYMAVSIVLVLLLTSILLTTWLGRSFIKPIDELNIAMQHIKDGNFDYILPTDIKEKGEIGAIYRNYEDMRLRLKESAEEKIERERQNRELHRDLWRALRPIPICSASILRLFIIRQMT